MLVTVAAVCALTIMGLGHYRHQGQIDAELAKADSAWTWVELLFSIGDDKEADAKIAELKRGTPTVNASPLGHVSNDGLTPDGGRSSRQEDQRAPEVPKVVRALPNAVHR